MSCGDQPLGRFGFPKLVHPLAQWLIPSVQGVRTDWAEWQGLGSAI